MEIIEASKKLITAQGTDLTLLYDDKLISSLYECGKA